MPDGQQQTFSNVTPIAPPQSFSDVTPVDQQEPEGVIKRTARGLLSGLGLPETLSDVPAWATRGIPGLDKNSEGVLPKHKEDIPIVGPVIKAFENPSSETIANAVPLFGPAGTAAAQKVRQGDYAGAIGTAVAAPLAIAVGTPEGRGALLDPVTGAAQSIWSKVSPTKKFEEALGSKFTNAEADTPRPGGQIQPALNNTPREVLQHAADEGIDLTPGQATENALAQNAQKSGVNAAVGGKQLANALLEQKTKFGQAVNNFMDEIDPKRAGLSAESAGQSIQDTQGVAKSVSHDNAAQGYQKIEYLMDKPVNPAPISAAWNQLKTSLPMGAEDSILAQTPRSMRAVVEDMLSGNPEGFKPTFSQGIQLRKFFRDLGDTEGLPNQMQSIYKQMSKAVDSGMETTANSMNSAQDWRAANAGWKDYATKYGDPQSILYKIGRQQDPTKIVTALQNAPATDILTVKQEMGDAALEPLRRQVVQDIAQSRFNIGHDGIGGYSDSYLKALFPPEQVKEIYLKGDLANRLKYDPNPSGTAGGLQSLDQLKFGNQAKMTTAAKLSMPRDPLSFLPDNAAKSPAGRGSLPEPISMGYRTFVGADGATYAEKPNGVKITIMKGTPPQVIAQKLAEQETAQAALKQRLFGGSQ